MVGQVHWFSGISDSLACSLLLLSFETLNGVWCRAFKLFTEMACWHFFQKLLDYEVDSDEEWEEEEPGESLSHSEGVRVPRAEK